MEILVKRQKRHTQRKFRFLENPVKNKNETLNQSKTLLFWSN